MARFIKQRSKTKGKVPGSLVFLGSQKESKVKLSYINFNKDQVFYDGVLEELDQLPEPKDKSILWLNIDGIHDTSVMQLIGERYQLHSLMLEDILNTDQRPKHEDFDDSLLIVLKMLSFNSTDSNLESEQVSIVIKNNVLITFQEREGDLFYPVRERIRKNKGKIRKTGSDYLAYALMDSIVDSYLDILGTMGQNIDELEELAITGSDKSLLSKIHYWKRELRIMHKSVMPFRDLILKILKMHNQYVKKENIQFYKDLLDLSQQTVDSTETYRDLLSDYHNIYNTVVSSKMNDVMKVLTIFASIFIPLTFLAGVYGTNFKNIPELDYKYSYFIMWGIFILIIIFMVIYFRRKKWL